jgi:hypothetical protein
VDRPDLFTVAGVLVLATFLGVQIWDVHRYAKDSRDLTGDDRRPLVLRVVAIYVNGAGFLYFSVLTFLVYGADVMGPRMAAPFYSIGFWVYMACVMGAPILVWRYINGEGYGDGGDLARHRREHGAGT